MKRVRLIVAYDGTNYCGWQIQPNGITVEEVLNKHLSELLKEPIAIIGASRTDSGVHALGNVAVFDTNTRIPAERISFALNQRLPRDIRIQKSDEVDARWHPRYQDSIKTYEYRIQNARLQNPIRRLYTYFVYYHLDVEKMQKAGKIFIGEHDFKSFCSTRTQAETTVRKIYDFSVKKEADEIVIRIKGNGFLYNMVRIIVGTLLRVGTGFFTPEKVEEILEAKDRMKAGPKVPPEGLTLIGIEYPNDAADE